MVEGNDEKENNLFSSSHATFLVLSVELRRRTTNMSHVCCSVGRLRLSMRIVFKLAILT
jgi:hypothetical protein